MKCLTRSPTLKRIMRGLFWEMITQVLSSGRTNCSLIFLGAFSSKLNLSRVLRCQELCVFRIMRLQNYASSELCVFRIMRLLSDALPSIPLWVYPGLAGLLEPKKFPQWHGSPSLLGSSLVLESLGGQERIEWNCWLA